MAQNWLQIRLKVGNVLPRDGCIFSSVTSVILPAAVDRCIESYTTLAPIFCYAERQLTLSRVIDDSSPILYCYFSP